MTELRIKELLKARGMTQATLAERMGISPIALSRMLKRGKPSFEALERMAAALQVEVPELFTHSGSRITCPVCGAQISITVNSGRRYFRHHRGSFEESMATMTEVGGIGDIRRIVEEGALAKGYYRNIRIGDGFADERCLPYGWGGTTYYVLADFDGYTGQCIGMANFKE